MDKDSGIKSSIYFSKKFFFILLFLILIILLCCYLEYKPSQFLVACLISVIFLRICYESCKNYLDYDWASTQKGYLKFILFGDYNTIESGLPNIKITKQLSDYEKQELMKQKTSIFQDEEAPDEELVVYKPGEDLEV